MASSSVVPPKEKYDVFLSFRGLDTRKTFTSHLHAALMMRKVVTYIDYKIEKGDEVGPALYKAIEESKFFVIIFSKDYASSTWCLDELAYILKCEKKNGQQGRVVPIFYEVEPSHVRHLIGTYKTAFAKHKQRSKDKVAEWKEALRLAASISGFDSTSKTVRDDADLVEQVVRYLLAKLNRESSSDLTDLIGGEGRIQKILLEYIIPEDICVRCVVLWGMGGIGKTTLADAVFHGLSSQFEAQCFLPNVRTRSGARGNCSPELYNLRNELLQKLLGDEKLTITTPTINAPVKERLRRMKVLVVLDDVNHSDQLTFLVREVPFGPGSRIILTTRDLQPVKETLQVKNVADFDVKIYEVEKLNGVESLELFHSNAPAHFKENLEFLTKVVDYAGGIPLALNVLRGLCHICNSKEELEQLWDRLKRDPEDRFQEVYRTSFDGLRKSEREIFLDIACFHKREKLCDTKRILAACGLLSDIGIKTLIDMSLISIKDDCIWMHDVIQEMGWEIVVQESPNEPEKRSRLHKYEDVCSVLKRNKGTTNVHCISYRHDDYNDKAKLDIDPRAFTSMDNLRFLELKMFLDDEKANLECLPDALRYLHWFQYPLQSLPSKFSPDNLVELHMPCSKLKRLWGESQNLNTLKRIDLKYSSDLAEVGGLSNSVNIESINFEGCESLVRVTDLSKCTCIKSINLTGCKSLDKVPDLSKSVNIESINFAGCESLVQVPSYFEKFTKLTHLDLQRCSKLRSLPILPGNIESLYLIGTAIEELTHSVCSLEKLHKLDLSCSSIKRFSSSPWKMRSLIDLCLRGTKIETVPSSSFLYMTEMASLDLRDCDRLVSLPADICELKSLQTLDLCGCSRFTTFPEIAKPLEHLKDLNLRKTNLKELPSSFGNLVGITKLNLSGCTNLESLPNGFDKFKFLEWFSLRGCLKLNELPLPFTLFSLKHLDLEGCELLKEIPDCFTNFPALEFLDLSGTMIETIPPSIEKVSGLKSLRVKMCKRLQSLPVLPCLLEKLDLSGTMIKTIPPSIKKVSGLKSLRVKMCKRLQSLPVLPCLLEKLDAEGCTRLEIVSVSVTSHTQGLDEMLSEMKSSTSNDFRTESHSFLGCVNLDKISKSDIMDDAYFRIMRLATINKLLQKRSAGNNAAVICPGNEIPKWFSYQTLQGSSLNIKLPLHWSDDSNFLGIALCSVVAIFARMEILLCGCDMILKSNNGEIHTVNLGTELPVSSALSIETNYTLVWYVPRISDEAKWSTEASFHFYTKVGGVKLYMVQSCGVCFLNSQTQHVVTTKEEDEASELTKKEHAKDEEEEDEEEDEEEFHSTKSIFGDYAHLNYRNRKRLRVVYPEKCDVFLSFRGVDTRETFTSHLHAALIRRKVKTYIDYRLERGDGVEPALYKVIEESKIYVIIFSKDYASSTWCLDELAYILKCNKKYGQHVIPVFYEVEPSHVRYQTGSYETAFAKHVQSLKDNSDKVKEWKDALVEAASLSGFDSKVVGDDSKLVEEVVGDLLAKLNREPSIDLTRLIGAEGRIQKILLELDIIPDDVRVRCVILWGVGAIGKTTLAKVVYHGLSSQFEAHCFLSNIRARSGAEGAFSHELNDLRNELLQELLGVQRLTIGTRTIGTYVKERLRRMKVLVVLDDVNDSSQLRYLTGEVQFGPGSRIIVTTRDMQPVKDTLLVKNAADFDVKIYKVEELNDVESRQLLDSIAPAHFTENSQYLKELVNHAADIPLALEILHPSFRNCETEEQLPKNKFRNVYTSIYGGLERNEKEIFLDIACFHKGNERSDIEKILAACGLLSDIGIKNLIDMSLISIKDGCIWMHDLIQEMAWETVRGESPQNPGERSRLYNDNDIRSVLEENKGTANVQSMSYLSTENKLKLDPRAFTGMANLRFLNLDMYHHYDDKDMANLECLPASLRYLKFDWYPLQSLPSEFSPDNLVELHMCCSKLKRLWEKKQNLNNLKRIDLSGSRDLAEVGGLSNSVNIESINLEGCERLVEVPDLSNCARIKSINLKDCKKLVQVPDISKSVNIESINLGGCESLVQVPSYFQRFTKLTHLDLNKTGIYSKEELPPSVFSLEKLLRSNISSISSITNLSSIPWKMISLNYLNLSYTKIERVPSSSFSYMTGIISLDLRYCDRLVSLPTDICKLKSLENLNLSNCYSFTTFPEIAEPMGRLQSLNLSYTKIERVPSSLFSYMTGIISLDLRYCESLVSLPTDICKLKSLQCLNLSYTKIERVPSSVGNLVGLEKLDLSNCRSLVSLRADICELKSLKTLNLSGCSTFTTFPKIAEPLEHLQNLNLSKTNLKELPSSFGNLVGIKELILDGCTNLKSLPNNFNKFKFLECFSLYGCVKLKEWPLSFILSSLTYLDCSNCKWLEELPDCFTSSTALRFLDLSGTMIETIPPSIEEVSGLESLKVRKCKRLRSLPVLPCLLERLDAEGCTRLETVSVSMTAHTQGLDEMLSDLEFYTYRTEAHSFLGCVNLNKNSKSHIMDDARFRFMRMSTASSVVERSTFVNVAVVCPGNEIPKWITYQTPQGSSLNIKLPLHWSDDSNFLGIALCSVLPICSPSSRQYRKCKCEMILKTNNGETHTVYLDSPGISVSAKVHHQKNVSAMAVEADNVFVWYNTYSSSRILSDEAKWSTEASFHFYTEDMGKRSDNVKSCGVCLLYAQPQDDNALKFEVIHPQQVNTASGSQSHFDTGSETYGE